MRQILCAAALLVLITTPLHAASDQTPESITSKMAIKFGRGITNIVTAVVEIPKQTVLMGREHGGVGYAVGPFGGVLMTGYRALIGATETVFFMVPAPGYYDEMIDPEFVWVGWGAKKQLSLQTAGADSP